MFNDRLDEIELNLIDTSLEGARTGNWTVGEGFEHHSFGCLVKSIERITQIEPGIVRPVEGKKPYQLVIGFRRYAALKLIAERDGYHTKFKAIIREVADHQVPEYWAINNCREAIVAPDLMVTLMKIRTSFDSTANQIKEIAAKAGIEVSFAALLIRIAENVDKDILNHWRHAPIMLSVGDMNRLSKLKTKEEQEKLYAKMTG